MIENVLVDNELSLELFDAIININKCVSKKKYSEWVPIGESLHKSILYEENKGTISKGQKVLELGGGSGDSILTWSYNSYPITSIELNKDIYLSSIKSLQKYEHIKNAPTNIYCGNYYLKQELENWNNNTYTRELEAEELAHLTWHNKKNVKNIEKRFNTASTFDVYKKYKIDLKEFDIWYAYLWPYQTPSVLDMFKKYARDDAIFLVVAYWGDHVAKRLGLKSEQGINYCTNIIRKSDARFTIK